MTTATRPARTALALLLALAVLGGGVYAAQRWSPTPGAADPVVVPPAPAPVVAPASAAPGPAPSPAPGRPEPATSGLATAGAAVDPGWLRRTAAAAGISEPALNAYARAELSAPAGCGVGWTTLAGVGWVESHHGTIGERTLGVDGRASRRILGPPLDGVGPVAAIAATPASTRYHGNPDWDHAVGPMQFIPTTWETWGVDGDGDGTADPDDLDDAALAAAGYLCADGRDLGSAEGWSAAVLSYNRSSAYVADVHAAATAYADRTGG